MKYTIILVALLTSVSCSILKNSYKVKENKSVQTYASSITAKELKEHLTIIASDKYEGRETGKKGQVMTAQYLKNEFIKDGVQPGNKGSFFQNFPLKETSKPEAFIEIHNKRFNFLDDFYFFQDYSNFQSFSVDVGNIVNVDNGIIEGNRNDYNYQNQPSWRR